MRTPPSNIPPSGILCRSRSRPRLRPLRLRSPRRTRLSRRSGGSAGSALRLGLRTLASL